MVRIICKVILAIILLPILLFCTIAGWICMFLSFVSSWILYALAMLLFLTAIGSAGFGLEPKDEVWRMMITSFVLFILPHIVEELAAGLLVVKYQVLSWIFQ